MTRSADRSFALLVLLALISSAILTTLLATLLPRADELFVRGTAGTADVVAVLVLLLAFAGIALGLVVDEAAGLADPAFVLGGAHHAGAYLLDGVSGHVPGLVDRATGTALVNGSVH